MKKINNKAKRKLRNRKKLRDNNNQNRYRISVTKSLNNLFAQIIDDKQKVGMIASKIKSFRPPEPYKGKGIKEKGQYILRKEGKKK